jgi:5-methylcytosine-specific restriction endonuclease McrA
MAKKKVTKPRKSTTPKTRNAGTMTESAFWGFIRSSLRQKSRWWKPITQAKDAAKRKYKGPNKRQKWEYLCNVCNSYFPNTEINVDHIIPAGTLRSAQDLPGFVERLFCEIDNLQVLCNVCHNKKTQDEKSKR